METGRSSGRPAPVAGRVGLPVGSTLGDRPSDRRKLFQVQTKNINVFITKFAIFCFFFI